MSRPTSKLLAAAIAALCAGVAFNAGAAPKKKEKTIGDLAQKPVVIQQDQKVEASSQRAMDNYRRFLELQKTDPQLRAEALRRLGDLNMEAGENDRMSTEAGSIDAQGAEAIKLYSNLLKSYPDYPRNDQVLYQLARAYETTGQPEKALASLDDILRRYPKSPQMDEVQFRRGELLFSARQYRPAQDAYGFVVKKGESTYLTQSLYKHGWSLFKQGLNDDSLPSFAGVLDRTLLSKQTRKLVPLDKLPRASRELADDTLRVMAVTFSYDDDSVAAIDNFLAGHNNPAYAPIVYSRLGDLYVEKERFQDAAAVYRAYATREPNSEFSPGLSQQAIEAYRKGGFTELVLEGKREYVALYNYGTTFWQGRNKADYPNIAKELKLNLKDVATYFHAEAQKTKKADQFLEAARWYRTYLESFPDDPESFGTNYLLSETLYSAEDYQGAAAEFTKTAYNYPRNPRSAAAAYAALGSFAKYEAKLDPAAKAEAHKVAVDAGVKFGTSFPEHPDSAGVLTRAAEDIFETQGSAALHRSGQPGARASAARRPAEAAHRAHHRGSVQLRPAELRRSREGFHRRARAHAAQRQDECRSHRTHRRIGVSPGRSQAEGRRQSRRRRRLPAHLAGGRFVQDRRAGRIRRRREPHQPQGIPARHPGARAFPLQQPEERIHRRRHAQAGGGLWRDGAGRAGRRGVRAHRDEPGGVQRHPARSELSAADLYAKAGNTPKAVTMLERFVVTYPTPVVDSIEARQKLADIAGNRRQHRRPAPLAARDRRRGSQTPGANRTDRTQYLAAKSQLALASPCARRLPRHPAGAAAQGLARQEAQGDGRGAGRVQERHRLPRGRSHHARHLRDRRDLPQAGPGRHEVRAARRS